MSIVKVECSGLIQVSNGEIPRELYAHQNEAIKALDQKNKDSFEGLLVLPTGGGKTLTAVHWLLRNFIDKRKKVLWIAHRHELLNQATETIKSSAYQSLLKEVDNFKFRVISGYTKHDIPVNIKATDDIIIASKDSLNSGLSYLINNWVEHCDSILLVVDEAHHATAKTYRKLIGAVKENLEKRQKQSGFRMLGLTATPFRTSGTEKGLLLKVFPDDIIFSENLRTLITKGILAEPIFENLTTNLEIYRDLSDRDVKAIEDFDKIPKKIAEKIAMSADRNRQIVDHYTNNSNKYKPVLVFAIDVDHALALNGLFKAKGVKSDFIVSQVVDPITGATIAAKENADKILRFRNGEIDVLINVEMLTEGTDLPNVQTVFLTRPTTSTILMTQMIGRALRGQKAGGTEKAYVVCFIDEWENKINWVNPEKLHFEEGAEIVDKDIKSTQKILRHISIEKIEEFTRIMDDSINTDDLEKLDFLKRVPVGIYHFSILEPSESISTESVERNYNILLYTDTVDSYEYFINDLEAIVNVVNLEDREILTRSELDHLIEIVKTNYFPNPSCLLAYLDKDIENVLRFYAQKQIKPDFIPFSERKKCDISAVAKYIYDNDLGDKAKAKHLEHLWDLDKSFWKILFGNKLYFRKQLDLEIYKLDGLYGDIPVTTPVVILDDVPLENLTLNEIKEVNLEEYRRIVDAVYAKATDPWDFIVCAISGERSDTRINFQIDHIKPMSEGGLTTLDNLQVLSRKAHRDKTKLENLNRSISWEKSYKFRE